MLLRSANTIADAILAKSAKQSILMSNLKLQKLLYYVQGFHLTKEGGPAFVDKLRAWAHGPVVPVVYHRFKKFSWHEITPPPEEPHLPEHTSKLIDKVLRRYLGFSALELEEMTHAELPWLTSRDHKPLGAATTPEISTAKLRAFFSGFSL